MRARGVFRKGLHRSGEIIKGHFTKHKIDYVFFLKDKNVKERKDPSRGLGKREEFGGNKNYSNGGTPFGLLKGSICRESALTSGELKRHAKKGGELRRDFRKRSLEF